jgi:hypothetical protein
VSRKSANTQGKGKVTKDTSHTTAQWREIVFPTWQLPRWALAMSLPCHELRFSPPSQLASASKSPKYRSSRSRPDVKRFEAIFLARLSKTHTTLPPPLGPAFKGWSPHSPRGLGTYRRNQSSHIDMTDLWAGPVFELPPEALKASKIC